jgi:hypothetical protein
MYILHILLYFTVQYIYDSVYSMYTLLLGGVFTYVARESANDNFHKSDNLTRSIQKENILKNKS